MAAHRRQPGGVWTRYAAHRYYLGVADGMLAMFAAVLLLVWLDLI